MALPATGSAARVHARAVPCSVMLVLLVHTVIATRQFPPGDPRNPLPFTQHDHPYHFYYGHLTARTPSGSPAFWGYDPHFMAGYARSLVFPTSSTLPELVVWVGGSYAGFAYRLFVCGSIWLTPILLALAARQLSGESGAGPIALVVGVLWVWTGFPASYVEWGMGPFILVSASSVWASVLLLGGLDRAARGARFGRPMAYTGGIVLAAASVIAHPSGAIILAAATGPGYLAQSRSLSRRGHLAFWMAPAIVVATWTPWWLPTYRLRGTCQSFATGFINENVWGRIVELLTARFPIESALWLAALGTGAGLSLLAAQVGFGGMAAAPGSLSDPPLAAVRARIFGVLGGVLVLFALGYLAGGVPAAGWLQPGRYTQPLYAWLVVLSSVGGLELVRRIRASGRIGPLFVAGPALAGAVGLAGWVLWLLGGTLLSPRLHATLPMPIRALARAVADHTDDSARILFEDRATLYLGDFDPFPQCNPSALLPVLVPRQYIGGPYLATHLKTNFTQVGDGRFFGRDLRHAVVSRALFERYADLYNVRWAVLWSAPLTRVADAHPDYFRPLGRFGYLRLYELARTPRWAVRGSARVQAEPGRLTVRAAQPDESGRLVLSYHWTPTLRASVPLVPLVREDDPVPFISVEGPPPQFVISDSWR